TPHRQVAWPASSSPPVRAAVTSIRASRRPTCSRIADTTSSSPEATASKRRSFRKRASCSIRSPCNVRRRCASNCSRHTASTRRTAARARLGLDPSIPTLGVFGGSLGSGPLNDSVPRAPLPPDVQVVHLAGTGRDDAVRAAWQTSGRRAVVLAYTDTIEDVYL